MATIKKSSRIIEEMQETFADLKKAGVVNKKHIAEFEALMKLKEQRARGIHLSV